MAARSVAVVAGASAYLNFLDGRYAVALEKIEALVNCRVMNFLLIPGGSRHSGRTCGKLPKPLLEAGAVFACPAVDEQRLTIFPSDDRISRALLLLSGRNPAHFMVELGADEHVRVHGPHGTATDSPTGWVQMFGKPLDQGLFDQLAS